MTELIYNPLGPLTAAEIAAGVTATNQFEYIELLNVGGASIDLTNLRFTVGVTFDFSTASQTSLAPGEYVHLVSDATAFPVRYGSGLPVIGVYTGTRLANGVEQLVLQLVTGTIVHDFSYDDAWHSGTDGTGFSLEIINPGAATSSWGLPSAWKASDSVGGTPGAPNESIILPSPGSIVINEILTHTDQATGDWIGLNC
jgi:hypothetical protein